MKRNCISSSKECFRYSHILQRDMISFLYWFIIGIGLVSDVKIITFHPDLINWYTKFQDLVVEERIEQQPAPEEPEEPSVELVGKCFV